MRMVAGCLEKFFPYMTEGDRQGFIYAFFPFLFGVYPYTVVTDRQKEAMEQACANYVFLSIYEITINEQIQNIAQKKDTLCRMMYN